RSIGVPCPGQRVAPSRTPAPGRSVSMPPAGAGATPRPGTWAATSAAATRRRVDDEYVAGRPVADVGGHRAEQPAGEGVQAAVADDVHEHVHRVARLADRVDVVRPGLLGEVRSLAEDVVRRV